MRRVVTEKCKATHAPVPERLALYVIDALLEGRSGMEQRPPPHQRTEDMDDSVRHGPTMVRHNIGSARPSLPGSPQQLMGGTDGMDAMDH